MRRLRRVLACVLAVLVVALGLVATPAQAQGDPKLTGTVADTSGPIGWPVLGLYRFDDDGWTFVDEVTGDADGSFTVRLSGLDAGVYTVKFSDGGHDSRWLGGTSALPATVGNGNHVTLPLVEDLNVGTVLLPATSGLAVRGTVRVPAGRSVAGLLVQLALSADDLAAGRAVDHAATSEDGSFHLSVSEAATYLVQVSDPSHALATVVRSVDITNSGQNLGTLSLGAANPSVVTGTVNAAGSPLPGVTVTTLVWHDDAPLWPDAGFAPYASATTAMDGSFSVPVEPGACFAVRYALAGYATAYLDGVSPHSCPDATGTRAAEPAPGTANPVPETTLVRAFRVSGRVRSALGTPVGFAAVSVYPAGRADDEASLITVSYADRAGSFDVRLPAGSYAFRFSGTDVPITAVTHDQVTVGGDLDLGVVPAELTRSVSGRILSSDGPLKGATATLTLLSGEHSGDTLESVTAADGGYEFPVVAPGTRFRLHWSAHGFETVVGEPVEMPAGGGPVPAVVTLPPSPSDLGRAAGQQLGHCAANRLPPGDDTASAAVPLPFAVRFFGVSHSSLFVNTNGSVSFIQPRAPFLPDQLTAATGVPIIAPFLADIDTSDAGDRLVSYGTDGDSFCVQWVDARQYGGDAHDTVQLLLTRTGQDGDFDLTLNYDRLAWDTGGSPQGTPAAAVAGFSDGTGTVGRSARFTGSGTAGSLLDGGANSLVGGNQNAAQPGRYVIRFRSADTGGFGTLTGTLSGPDGSAAAGIVVSACRSVQAEAVCDTTTSRADGSFGFVALPAADYRLDVVGGRQLETGPVAATVAAESRAAVGVLRLRPTPSPSPSPTPSPTGTPPVVAPPDHGSTASPSPSVTPTRPPLPALKKLRPATPTISGTRRVGRTLKARPGTWRPAGVKLSYQWLRTGTSIKGATKATYKLRNADRGSRIRVVVTGRKSGYGTISRMSPSTARVKRR